MDSSLAITLDTLRTAQALRGRGRTRAELQWSVIGQRRTVHTGGGLRLTADLTFREVLAGPARAEWLIVPGLGLTSAAAIAARLRRPDARAAIAVLRERRVAKYLAASCSAVFLLADAGLLDGRSATTTW